MRQPLSQSERDNLPRWNGHQARFYEVWFFKFNIPEANQAFWLRFTLLKPLDQEPVAELWAICFDANEGASHRTFKQAFPVSQFSSSPGLFQIRIGDSVLKQDGTEGRIEDSGGSIGWKLSYKPNYISYHHIPPLLMKMPWPKTKVCTPHMNISYDGEVTVDGNVYPIRQARGMQGHIWGKEHAHSWVWAHCNLFRERPDVWLEALSGRVQVAGQVLPPLSPIYIHYQGQVYQFNDYRSLVKNQSHFEPGSWHFSAIAENIGFRGEIRAAPTDMVGLRYTDPNHSYRYCYNAKIGDCRLDVLQKHQNQWHMSDTVYASKTCAVEWVGPEPLPGYTFRE